MPMMRQYKSIEHKTEDLCGQCHEFDFFSDGVQGGLYLSYWDENEGMLVRAPGLEPESGVREALALLGKLSKNCLGDTRKGRTATSRKLLTTIAGLGEMVNSEGKRSVTAI